MYLEILATTGAETSPPKYLLGSGSSIETIIIYLGVWAGKIDAKLEIYFSDA
tara:strand:+ start:1574 stop:1729 length:156 start_codon:yes stop_codon:yes gene_type:complete